MIIKSKNIVKCRFFIPEECQIQNLVQERVGTKIMVHKNLLSSSLQKLKWVSLDIEADAQRFVVVITALDLFLVITLQVKTLNSISRIICKVSGGHQQCGKVQEQGNLCDWMKHRAHSDFVRLIGDLWLNLLSKSRSNLYHLRRYPKTSSSAFWDVGFIIWVVNNKLWSTFTVLFLCSFYLLRFGYFLDCYFMPGMGGYSRKIWVGVCGTLLETLTLFQIKICDCPYPISDLTLKISDKMSPF